MGHPYIEPVSARLLLSLWRERWGKASTDASSLPYLRGKINQWSNRLAHAQIWSLPFSSMLIFIGCLLFFALQLTVRFSPLGQLGYSLIFIGAALYVRRFQGMVFTLMLLAMAFLVSSQYLNWRFNSTLGVHLNSDFLFGFGLWLAELYLFLLTGFHVLKHIWPLTWSKQSLPKETYDWPSIDVFIAVHNQSEATIQSLAASAMAMAWPPKKITFYLLDNQQRDDIELLSHNLEIHYLSALSSGQDLPEMANQALAKSTGDLILLLDGARGPHAQFLHQTVGWLFQHPSLGMVETPDHSLAPGLNRRSRTLFQETKQGPSFSLTRRSMLAAAGGFSSAPVTEHDHTALNLQALGFGCAYAGWSNNSAPVINNARNAGKDRTLDDADVFCVNQPFNANVLCLQQYLHGLVNAMQFYYPSIRFVFFASPVAYLLAGVYVIQTTPDFWLLYALPHLLMGRMVLARLNDKSRLTIFSEMNETITAWYLLLPTTLTFIRTRFNQFWSQVGQTHVHTMYQTDRLLLLAYGSVGLLNLIGLVLGSWYWFEANLIPNDITPVYLLWSVFNLLCLATMFSVTEEAKAIHHHQQTSRNLSVMLKLMSGRSVSSMTQNFPDLPLVIKSPSFLNLPIESVVGISLFYRHHEFPFNTKVVLKDNETIHVNIDQQASMQYHALASTVFARHNEWPKWLPGRHADRPWPHWVSQHIGNVSVFFSHAAALHNWIQKWKKK